MKRLYFFALLAFAALNVMAQAITLSGDAVSSRTHDTDAGTYTVAYTSTNNYQVALKYTSTQETGTFTEADLDAWESFITDPQGAWWNIVTANVTVAIDPDKAYHLTGTLNTESNDDPTLKQDFVLDLHRAAPTAAADTVTFTCANAAWSSVFDYDSFTENATFTATVDGKTLTLVYNAWAGYTGELEPANIDKSQSTVSYNGATYPMDQFVSGEVLLETDHTFNLTALAVFADTLAYQISMKAPIPSWTEQQNLVLDNLSASFNDWSAEVNLMASNSNLQFNFYLRETELRDGHYEGQGFTAEITDMSTYDVYMAYYISADLYVSNPDSQVVTADVYASNGVLYHLTLNNILPVASDTVSLNIPDAQFVNMENAGQYKMSGTADGHTVSLTIQTDYFEQGTTYTDFDIKSMLVADLSFIISGEGDATFRAGTISAARDAQDNVTFTAHVLGSNAVFYNIVMQGTWERQHLEADSEDGEVDFTFGDDSDLEVDFSGLLNYAPVYIELNDKEEMHSLAVELYCDPAEPEDGASYKIPAGVYTIENSGAMNTVLPSSGKYFDIGAWEEVVTPTLFVELATANDPSSALYYFLVEGTLRVDYDANGSLCLEMNAYNSYGVHVVVRYGNMPEAVHNISTNAVAEKIMMNGKVLIRRGNGCYTLDGHRL